MAKYGYVRVSTLGQYAKGNSIEAQLDMLKNNGVPENNIFIDKVSGAKMQRQQFDKLLDVLKDGDELVVTKLDRFARSLIEGNKIINELLNRGVSIYIMDLGVLNNTPTSQLIRNILLALAEFERTLIIERTQSGKEIAKQKQGYKEGRPKKYNNDKVDFALSLMGTKSGKEIERLTGISRSTLYRYKRQKETVY